MKAQRGLPPKKVRRPLALKWGGIEHDTLKPYSFVVKGKLSPGGSG